MRSRSIDRLCVRLFIGLTDTGGLARSSLVDRHDGPEENPPASMGRPRDSALQLSRARRVYAMLYRAVVCYASLSRRENKASRFAWRSSLYSTFRGCISSTCEKKASGLGGERRHRPRRGRGLGSRCRKFKAAG